MNQLSPLHIFSEQTKLMCILISIAVVVLFVTMSFTGILSPMKTNFLKVAVIGIMAYVLFINFIETNKLVKAMPDLFLNENLIKIRNNALLSYTLCLFIMILICYIAYSLFIF